MYYSVVGVNGYIRLSQVTQTTDYPILNGERLLPDNPPDPRKGDYIPNVTKPLRVEPVPMEATEILYEIVPEVQTQNIPTEDRGLN